MRDRELFELEISRLMPGDVPEYQVAVDAQGASGVTTSAPFALTTIRPARTATSLLVISARAKKAYDDFHRANPGAAPADHPPFVQVQQAPRVFWRTILNNARAQARRAGDTQAVSTLDFDTWFTQFTRISFLGQSFEAGDYVHVDFARKLQQIEAALVQAMGGTAATVGATLLHRRGDLHKGSRMSSATAGYSYHMLGLAIDVNYLGNPYIQDADVRTFRDVIKNASRLLRNTDATYARGSGLAHYDAVAELDQLLETYFALVDDAAALRSALAATRNAGWRRKSPAVARNDINRDLRNLRRALSRDEDTEQRDAFKTRAILDFDRRLVDAMISAGLDWGAWYGDMMHFDMRTTGVGRYINAAIAPHRARATQQRDRFLAARDYGYHDYVD